MTLIAYLQSLNGQSFAMGDVLLWGKKALFDTAPLPFVGPDWRGKSNNHVDMKFTNVTQKFYVHKKSILVAWAGSYVLAASFIRGMIEDNIEADEFELYYDSFLTRYSLQEVLSFSLMCIVALQQKKINDFHNTRILTHNCNMRKSTRAGDLWLAGSGSYDFYKQFVNYAQQDKKNPGMANTANDVNPYFSLLFTSSHFCIQEYLTGPNLAGTFGGAFEIAHSLKNLNDWRCTVEKTVELVHIFWLVRKDANPSSMIVPMHLIFQTYLNDELIVLRMEGVSAKESSTPVTVWPIPPVGLSVKHNNVQLSDVAPIKPMQSMNYFHIPGGGPVKSFIFQAPRSQLEVTMLHDGFELHFDSIFFDELTSYLSTKG